MKRYIIILILVGVLIMSTKKVVANPVIVSKVEPFRDLATKYGNAYGVPSNLILAQISVETGGNPSLVGTSGETGLMQILPTTLPDINGMLGTAYAPFDLQNPEIGIQCGAAYLHWLYNMFRGNLSMVIRAYNAGVGTIQEDSSKGQDYLDKVSAYLFYFNGETA